MTNFFRLHSYFRRSTKAVALFIPSLHPTPTSRSSFSNSSRISRCSTPSNHERIFIDPYELPVMLTHRLSAATAKKPPTDYFYPVTTSPSLLQAAKLDLTSRQTTSNEELVAEKIDLAQNVGLLWGIEPLPASTLSPPLLRESLRNVNFDVSCWFSRKSLPSLTFMPHSFTIVHTWNCQHLNFGHLSYLVELTGLRAYSKGVRARTL